LAPGTPRNGNGNAIILLSFLRILLKLNKYIAFPFPFRGVPGANVQGGPGTRLGLGRLAQEPPPSLSPTLSSERAGLGYVRELLKIEPGATVCSLWFLSGPGSCRANVNAQRANTEQRSAMPLQEPLAVTRQRYRRKDERPRADIIVWVRVAGADNLPEVLAFWLGDDP